MGSMHEVGCERGGMLHNAATEDTVPALSDTQRRCKLVGMGFRVVEPVFLMEVGDEYLDAGGKFVAVPLDRVGAPVPQGVLVRRLERRH
jgi:hypothetical protein